MLDLLIHGQSPGIETPIVDLYEKPELLFFGPDGRLWDICCGLSLTWHSFVQKEPLIWWTGRHVRISIPWPGNSLWPTIVKCTRERGAPLGGSRWRQAKTRRYKCATQFKVALFLSQLLIWLVPWRYPPRCIWNDESFGTPVRDRNLQQAGIEREGRYQSPNRWPW